MNTAKDNKHYSHLPIMISLSFITMYVLMYSMVDVFVNAYNSLNQVYMAGIIAASMVVIEILVMWGMYHNRKLNILITAVGFIAMIGFFVMIRQQSAIGDKQFLRSMIPHHAGAILICLRSSDALIHKSYTQTQKVTEPYREPHSSS